MKYLHIITRDQFYSKKFIELIQSHFNTEEHQFIIMKKLNEKIHINPEKYPNIKSFTISSEKNVLEFIVSNIKFFTVNYMKIRNLGLTLY